MTPTYLLWFAGAAVVVALLVLLLGLGWRARRRRQRHLPAPAALPEELVRAEPLAAGEGMVIGTVDAADPLDRVAVHGLGIRTDGRLEVHESGVAVFRAGAPNHLIPREDLTHARTDRGVVGRFVERDGALIVGWRLGDQRVETAFRARHADAHRTLLEALHRLTPTTDATLEEPASTDPEERQYP
ncbi:hypothetical protein GCM10027060_03580 [Nesterenkonia halophila]|uniref:PH-like domain-containing protein n=1 Tax=Nesterenkonia halophila TaxID=302044 RepID=UPI0012924E8B|nr:hypothetical protein [Nesterenkonia halophila]